MLSLKLKTRRSTHPHSSRELGHLKHKAPNSNLSSSSRNRVLSSNPSPNSNNRLLRMVPFLPLGSKKKRKASLRRTIET
jgi:hypothetical protein